VDEVSWRDYVDRRCDELARRLDESASDRERIREGIGSRVTRVEHDVVLERLNKLEGQLSRLYGGLAVVGLVIAVVGLALRYLVH